MDDLEEDKLFWITAEQAGKAGAPLPAFLRLQNWDEEEIELIEGSTEYQSSQAAREMMLELPAGGELGCGSEQEKAETQAEGQQ